MAFGKRWIKAKKGVVPYETKPRAYVPKDSWVAVEFSPYYRMLEREGSIEVSDAAPNAVASKRENATEQRRKKKEE